MTFERHLVAFVKAPCLGRVKSRLASDIGAVAACRFYRETTRSVLRRLGGRHRRWRLWLAVTPDHPDPWPTVWPRDWERLPQGRGELGVRMARILGRLPPGPVVIIGTDIPQIGVSHLDHAFRALGDHAAVLGPAPDGGYWLIGLRRRPVARRWGLFDGVRWSTPHALADTVASLGDARIAMLESLEDVDDGASFRRWRAANAPARR